jgi:hypothetical protein
MSDLRKQIAEAAQEAAPEIEHELVPQKKKAKTTRADRRARRLARDAKYGKPTPIRMQESTRQALDRAADHYNVGKHKLAEFLIVAGLHLLARGKIELPMKEEKAQVLDLPAPPKSFPSKSNAD